MVEFNYIARDNTGQKVTGTITAASRREAVAAISSRALFPIEVNAAGQSGGKKLRRVPALGAPHPLEALDQIPPVRVEVGYATRAVFSPDRMRVAVGSRGGDVHLFTPETGRVGRRCPWLHC